MSDRKLDPSRFKFEPNRYRKEKMEMGEAVSLLNDCDKVIIIDPDVEKEKFSEKGADDNGNRVFTIIDWKSAK